MRFILEVDPVFWATAILISGSAFTVFWLLDAMQHKELVKVDITQQELQTHRNILIVSLLMEVSLVLMFWFHIEVLPFFLALFITRTAHEFIDELHWHTDRCSSYETMLHLGMWISVLSNTFLMFMWGFFMQYEGVLNLHTGYYIWAVAVFIVILIISWKEWRR